MPPQSSPTTSTSFQPTHTSNAHSSSSDGGGSSPIGSPPLILAFLAIGIFAAAMIAVFGWRRVHFGSFQVEGVRGEGRRFGGTSSSDSDAEGSKLGKKPILWDVWLDRGTKVDSVEYGFWDNIMPLAVLPAPHNASNLALTADQSPPAASSEAIPLTSLPSIGARDSIPTPRPRQRFDDLTPMSLFRRNNRSTTAAADDPLSQNRGGEHRDKEDTKDQKMALVSVIIEMPSPTSSRQRHNHHRSTSHTRSHSPYSSLSRSETLIGGHDQFREDILGAEEESEFQYCVGVHACPWPISTTPSTDGPPTRIPQTSTKVLE